MTGSVLHSSSVLLLNFFTKLNICTSIFASSSSRKTLPATLFSNPANIDKQKIMVNVLTEITIYAPLAKVADYAANPDNAPKWYVNIKSADWKTPQPLTVGSQVAFVAHFLGRNLAYTYEFIELVPRQKIVMRTAEGPFPMETTYTWTAVDDNTTKMTLRNSGLPTGFSKLIAPFITMMMRKANNNDLKKLKHLLENART